MNSHLKICTGLAVALVAASSAFAQNVTKPAGFRTETLKAGFNLISVELTGPITAAGTAGTVAGATITDPNAAFQDLLPAPDSGATIIVDVCLQNAPVKLWAPFILESFTDTGFTVGQDLEALGVEADAPYEIRVAKTLTDIFGATNQAGLNSGATDAASDKIWLPNSDGTFNRYFYKTGGLGGDGWRLIGDLGGDQAATAVLSSEALFVERLAGTPDLDVVFVGHVPTRGATLPLIAGFNFVSRIAVAGANLGDSGLFDQLQRGPTDTAADVVWNPDGNGGYARYFPKEGGLGTNGWRLVGDLSTDRADVGLSSGIIIQRRGDPANVNLGVPEFYAGL